MNSDFVLIMKMKRGDEAALERFVRKYYQIILNYCNYHCFDGSYAEDLTQETFARFFEKLSDYRCMGKTLNYLYTIAGNLCRDYYKKKKESLLEDEQKEPEDKAGKQEIDRVVEKNAIEEALASLPFEMREVIILYYFEERKLSEIADILHIGLPLVKYRIRQAKMKLKVLLKEV